METIKQIADRLNLSSETVAQKLRDKGVNPDAIPADKVDEMAALLGGGALATGSSAKPAAKKRGRPRKTKNETSIEAGLTHAAQLAQSEIGAFIEQIDQGASRYEDAIATEAASRIREMPTRVVNSVAARLSEEVADTETFRQEGTRWADALFQTGFLGSAE